MVIEHGVDTEGIIQETSTMFLTGSLSCCSQCSRFALPDIVAVVVVQGSFDLESRGKFQVGSPHIVALVLRLVGNRTSKRGKVLETPDSTDCFILVT